MAVMMDGNEAAARVAYATSEVVAIYPITPSSAMGEWADRWSSDEMPNLWGEVPRVLEMQSEGGAAGALHGALQAGSLATSFTSSQGLLLMLPNMFKIAGELTSMVLHVATRSLATHALSIFGDHSDVMTARSTGYAMLFSSTVQEVHDQALLAMAASLESRVPCMHCFDGFRTSHEVTAVETLTPEVMRALLPADRIEEHRRRALSPDHPVVRGTAQNPDVFFQAREAANPFYERAPEVYSRLFERFAELTGRRYQLFEYRGHPEAERVVIAMGSAAETVFETVAASDEKVGAIKVRLYRPFSLEHLQRALPATCRAVAVLDRCKEPGAPGEPLFLDVAASLECRVIGGRYGLASKELTPAMVRAVFAELAAEKPRRQFSLGIEDDVGHLSLAYDPSFSLEDPDSVRAMFWGLGSDGTVGANKSSIKIIGEQPGVHAQAYFVYDSRKAGARTISHLRFGPRPVNRAYLIERASFVGIHQFDFVERYPVLERAEPGATVLLNSPYSAREVWKHLPSAFQRQVLDLKLRLYVVDASRVARECGLGRRINTVMQTCFFALCGLDGMDGVRREIEHNYPFRKDQNLRAVDMALETLAQVEPGPCNGVAPRPQPAMPRLTAELLAERGDRVPVSWLPVDGTFPPGTARYERRNLAPEVPVWDAELCIQCGKCVLVCPHAAIRAKLVEPARLAKAPPEFLAECSSFKSHMDLLYTLQVDVEDCTGCTLCVDICPVRDKSHAGRKALEMADQRPRRETGRACWDFFQQLETIPPPQAHQVKEVQLLQPCFEFSGACVGCGETPYLKLLSQLFGERAIVANATGCSSIYGGNLPTTPWGQLPDGRGPAWSNSLFEDNAEFALGIRVALDHQAARARRLAEQDSLDELERRDREALSQQPRSVWAVGGDGWAYDIGYGGLDHLFTSGANVNVLVLDTEVYSNTGGQSSKATPLAAVAKFAAAGKGMGKKDLGMLAIQSGRVYVAQVAMGANDTQTVRAFREAEEFPGPSLIIAYSHCIAHGIDMAKGLRQQKLAVETGHWLLYRYDPRTGLELDCKEPVKPLREYLETEGRFQILGQTHPERAAQLAEEAQQFVRERYRRYLALT